MSGDKARETFMANKMWVACNFCLVTITVSARFAILDCHHSCCTLCAEKYRDRNTQNNIMCQICNISTDWRAIAPSLDVTVELLFDRNVVNMPNLEFQQLNAKATTSYFREVYLNRGSVRKLRGKTIQMDNETKTKETYSKGVEDKICGVVPPDVYQKLIDDHSASTLRKINFGEFVSSFKSRIDNHIKRTNDFLVNQARQLDSNWQPVYRAPWRNNVQPAQARSDCVQSNPDLSAINRNRYMEAQTPRLPTVDLNNPQPGGSGLCPGSRFQAGHGFHNNSSYSGFHQSRYQAPLAQQDQQRNMAQSMGRNSTSIYSMDLTQYDQNYQGYLPNPPNVTQHVHGSHQRSIGMHRYMSPYQRNPNQQPNYQPPNNQPPNNQQLNNQQPDNQQADDQHPGDQQPDNQQPDNQQQDYQQHGYQQYFPDANN